MCFVFNFIPFVSNQQQLLCLFAPLNLKLLSCCVLLFLITIHEQKIHTECVFVSVKQQHTQFRFSIILFPNVKGADKGQIYLVCARQISSGTCERI